MKLEGDGFFKILHGFDKTFMKIFFEDCILNQDNKEDEAMLYGVIDIGSNTIRLMIYRVEADGAIHPVLNNKFAAGLAGYIGPKGAMNRGGIRRAVEILAELRTVTEQIALDGVFPFGTAALRNITNTEEVLSAIRAESGFDVRVLSGEEEAEFDYYGAIQSTPAEGGLLVDVGGGSTEVVYFTKRKAVMGVSIPVGSLTLYNRFVGGILPSRSEVRKIEEEAAARLAESGLRIRPGAARQIVAVGGTARAAWKLYSSLEGKKGKASYPAEFYGDFLSQMEMGPEKLTDRVLKLAPERIHTITPGVAVLHTVVKTFGGRTVTTSPYGVREGYLYYLLKERGLLDGTQQ